MACRRAPPSFGRFGQPRELNVPIAVQRRGTGRGGWMLTVMVVLMSMLLRLRLRLLTLMLMLMLLSWMLRLLRLLMMMMSTMGAREKTL